MIKYKPMGLNEVVLTDDYCVNALFKEVGYLLSFDTERLLAGFYETAGLPVKGEGRYGGWETWLIGGHTLGHYLTACAQAYLNAGVSEKDKEALYDKCVKIIDGLLVCQANSKGKEGFVFAGKILDINNVEIQFDNVEKGKSHIITEAWVPWYTMHKILAGVVDTYKFTGYEGALKLAKGIGDWTYERVMSWDEATHNTVLSIEYGGMNDALYGLYEISGEDKYAIAAHMFDEDALFERVLAGGTDVLNNKHANTTIPKFVGAVNRYMIMNGKTVNGETVNADRYLEYGKAFWQMVIDRHTYITGANSEWEHFGKDGILDAERTNCNNETCNVYNMLKLTRLLFEATGDAKYADYYEKAYINSILSSQNPKTGMTTYFQPMASGYFKTYGEPFTKFWCCTGSGMENFTKLNDSLYFYGDKTLWVNMFFSSEVLVEECGLKVVQTADIPASDEMKFEVVALSDKYEPLNLRLRIPAWTCLREAKVIVNGRYNELPAEEGYFEIVNVKAGDEIVLKLPMKVKAEGLADCDNVFAFTYGPLVLSADMGCEDMQITTTGVMVTIPANSIVKEDYILKPEGSEVNAVNDWINDIFTPDATKHEFTVKGSEYKFSIHYLKNHERYGIYWYMEDENSGMARMNSIPSETVLDTVQPGYGQYENDELHMMEDNGSVSVTDDGSYRYAVKGGSFSYRMAVDCEKSNALLFMLRKEDNGKTLKIEAEGRTFFYETLSYSDDEEIYKVRATIPREAVAEAKEVTANGEKYKVITISFSGFEGMESARVCDSIKTVV